jgi:uncharacterized protein YodC (DUF2158 family)
MAGKTKLKRGRPPKERPRQRLLEVRLEVSEKQAFKDAAELSGLGLSTWVRERLRQVARRELEEAGRKVAFLEEWWSEIDLRWRLSMSYEEIAEAFLAHLASKDRKLQRIHKAWKFENSVVAFGSEPLEHILRTYLLEVKIPQSTTLVSNVVTILRVMLDPHPLGKIDADPPQQENNWTRTIYNRMNKKTLTCGNIVRFNGGSPPLTVLEVCADKSGALVCGWFDDQKQFHTDIFPEASIAALDADKSE